MYSKNDYRYYLENQLMHSDDFLAHYGVKGMKWKKHLKAGSVPKDLTYEKRKFDIGNTEYKDYRLDFDKHYDKDGSRSWSEGVGVRVSRDKDSGERKLSLYNTKRVKLDKDGYAKYEHKKKGRFEKTRAEDGVSYDVDLTKRKDRKKVKKKHAIQDTSFGEWQTTNIAKSALKKSSKKK